MEKDLTTISENSRVTRKKENWDREERRTMYIEV